jgi:hypothetical protein
METRGQHILRNIKGWWISMLLPAKIILSEYKALVLKMHQDSTTISQVAHNLYLMCDLEVILGLSCLMPMLEGLNEFIKFSQSRQCFVCDFFFMWNYAKHICTHSTMVPKLFTWMMCSLDTKTFLLGH